MNWDDLGIILMALGVIGVFLLLVGFLTTIKQKESMPQEPVVCVVQMNSKANNQTHNFKGVVK